MVAICNKKDIENSTVDFKIKKVLYNHLCEILKTYDIEDISDFGAIYYISDEAEYKALNDANPVIEWASAISINYSNITDKYFYFCVVCDNDTALNILAKTNYLSDELTSQLDSATNRLEYYYFISDQNV